MRKGDEDWVKKVWSIELKAEDRLEDQEADMSKLEIDKEDVHDRKKECCEEEVQPYRKTDNKPIIYISSRQHIHILQNS